MQDSLLVIWILQSRYSTKDLDNNLKVSYHNDAMIKMSDAILSCLSKAMQMEKVILSLYMLLVRAFLEYSIQL